MLTQDEFNQTLIAAIQADLEANRDQWNAWMEWAFGSWAGYEFAKEYFNEPVSTPCDEPDEPVETDPEANPAGEQQTDQP